MLCDQRNCACPLPGSVHVQVNGALSNVVKWKVSLSIALGLVSGNRQGPFQSTSFYDSVRFSVWVDMDADSPKGSPAGWVFQVRNPSAYCIVILFL